MKIGAPSILGMAFATVAGGTYVVTGERDFELAVNRPLPEVYAAFGEVGTYGSELRNAGIAVPPIERSRPSDRELIYTLPSANPGQVSRIALTFTPQDTVTTRVSAAIDVPPIVMSVDGQDKVLSEDKVETMIREAITDMGKSLDQGNGSTAGGAKLARTLDMVALASNPEQMRRAVDRMERVRAEATRAKDSLREDGWEVRDTRHGFEGEREWTPEERAL